MYGGTNEESEKLSDFWIFDLKTLKWSEKKINEG